MVAYRNRYLYTYFYSAVEVLPKFFEDELKNHKRAYPKVYLKPFEYKDEPIIYSEIGGFGYNYGEKVGNQWGYRDLLESGEELLNKVINLFREFEKRKSWIQGFCYTELYGQFQEVNGLLTLNREPKSPSSKLKEQLEKIFY